MFRLRERVRQGKFREDLYHRLNGLTILIPRCGIAGKSCRINRERAESVRLKTGKKITAIHPAAMDRLLVHDWRGNLRELSHTVRTMTLFCDGDVIMPEHVTFRPTSTVANRQILRRKSRATRILITTAVISRWRAPSNAMCALFISRRTKISDVHRNFLASREPP